MCNCHFTSFTLWGRNVSLERGLHKTVFQTMPVYSIQGICTLFRLWHISHCIITADLLLWGSKSCGCNEEKVLSILLCRAPATSLAYLSSDLRQVPIAAFVSFSRPFAERAKADMAQPSPFNAKGYDLRSWGSACRSNWLTIQRIALFLIAHLIMS